MAIPNSFDILNAVIEATLDVIFVKDLEGRYVLVNEAFCRFIGKTNDEIVGRNDFELYSEADARAFVNADRQVLASGRPQVFEGVATGPDGVNPRQLGAVDGVAPGFIPGRAETARADRPRLWRLAEPGHPGRRGER